MGLKFCVAVISSKLIISILVDKSKIKEELINIFIIGLFVEFLRSLLSVIKNYKLSENKLIYEVYSLILPAILLSLSPFLFLNSTISFAAYMLLIYFFYFVFFVLFSIRLKKNILNIV